MLSIKNACFKKRGSNMRNYCFTLFTCFCFRLLRLWFVFLNSVSVLRFNFVFLGVFLFWDAYFRLGIWVFLFWVCVLSMCFCFEFVLSYFCCYCCCLVVFLFLSATLYIWQSLHLNPTTGEHFKTPLKISSQISNRPGKK